MKKLFAILLALAMVAALAACGDSSPAATQAPATQAPAATQTPAATEAPKSLAGSYDFEYTDLYGDLTMISVILGADQSVMLTMVPTGDSKLSGVLNGSEWSDNGDGTVTTGALDGVIKGVDWMAEDGAVTWEISGTEITPVGYTVPTAFLEKSAVSDPTSAMECVGVYTFGEYNAEHDSTTPFVVWVNADGTYHVYRDNRFLGLRGATGEWTYEGDSVVAFGPATFDEEGADLVAVFFDQNDWSSEWKLSGDGTCVPTNYEGDSKAVDLSSLSDSSLYPAGAEYVGVYTFGEYNAERDSTTPFIVWVNADGTYHVYRDNKFLGLRGATGEWTYKDDGVFAFGAATFDEEGADLVGAFFNQDDWSSEWQMNHDGTCVPTNFEGDVRAVDFSSISDQSLVLAG